MRRHARVSATDRLLTVLVWAKWYVIALFVIVIVVSWIHAWPNWFSEP